MYETISKGDVEAIDDLMVEVETIKGQLVVRIPGDS